MNDYNNNFAGRHSRCAQSNFAVDDLVKLLKRERIFECRARRCEADPVNLLILLLFLRVPVEIEQFISYWLKTQVSLLPPPCEEFTTSDPRLSATRVRPPGTMVTLSP